MIVLCINCGWLGTEKDLGAMSIKSDKFQAIIESNSMYVRTCPRCKETELCYKTECDYSIKSPPEYGPNLRDVMADIEQVVEKHSEPESDTGVDEILSIAETSNVPTAQLGPDGTIKMPRAKAKEQKCDICGETFKANYITSRCDKCYDKLMNKMQVEVDKEQKKSKKKVAKKRAKDHSKTMKVIRNKKNKKVS